MLASVRDRIIDGEQWTGERLTFLKERLAGEVADDERHAIEAEIGVLSKERGVAPAALRTGRIGRRLRRKT